MEITRQSPFGGRIHTIDIPGLTQEMLDLWRRGTLLQDAMPTISAGHRKFIKTGITPEEWDETFGGR